MELDEIVGLALKWAVPFVLTEVVMLLGSLWAMWKMFKNKFKALGEGVQCLERQKIIDIHDERIKKGYCQIYKKEALKRLYDSYHALGGNDVATALYEEVMALPVEKPIDKSEVETR